MPVVGWSRAIASDHEKWRIQSIVLIVAINIFKNCNARNLLVTRNLKRTGTWLAVIWRPSYNAIVSRSTHFTMLTSCVVTAILSEEKFPFSKDLSLHYKLHHYKSLQETVCTTLSINKAIRVYACLPETKNRSK